MAVQNYARQVWRENISMGTVHRETLENWDSSWSGIAPRIDHLPAIRSHPFYMSVEFAFFVSLVPFYISLIDCLVSFFNRIHCWFYKKGAYNLVLWLMLKHRNDIMNLQWGSKISLFWFLRHYWFQMHTNFFTVWEMDLLFYMPPCWLFSVKVQAHNF